MGYHSIDRINIEFYTINDFIVCGTDRLCNVLKKPWSFSEKENRTKYLLNNLKFQNLPSKVLLIFNFISRNKICVSFFGLKDVLNFVSFTYCLYIHIPYGLIRLNMLAQSFVIITRILNILKLKFTNYTVINY